MLIMTGLKLIINIFLINLLLINIGFTGVFPRGCEVQGFSYENGMLILNDTGEQTLYLIQNHSSNKIMLEHFETKEVFLSPKLRNKVNPGNWSAFASDMPNQHFKCFNIQNNDQVEVSCNDILEICQYPRVKFALSNMGTYWVSVNKPQPQVLKDAIAKGILLHW